MHSRSASRWFRRKLEEAFHLILVFALVLVGFLALLHAARILWGIYQETPVGKEFMAHYMSVAQGIRRVLSFDPLALSTRASLCALVGCLAVALCAEFLALKRYFYDPQGLVSRGLVWGPPCVAATALALSRFYKLDWGVIASMGALPALGLLGSCFKFIPQLVPEIGTLFSAMRRLVSRLLSS